MSITFPSVRIPSLVCVAALAFCCAPMATCWIVVAIWVVAAPDWLRGLRELAGELGEMAAHLDRLDEGVAERAEELLVFVGEVVALLGELEAGEIEARAFHGVEEEGVADRLHVEVEDGEDRLLRLGPEAAPEAVGALELGPDEGLVEGVGAEVPLERQVHDVVPLADEEALLVEGRPELAARHRLAEHVAQVLGLVRSRASRNLARSLRPWARAQLERNSCVGPKENWWS